jgi:hypothetical protein
MMFYWLIEIDMSFSSVTFLLDQKSNQKSQEILILLPARPTPALSAAVDPPPRSVTV